MLFASCAAGSAYAVGDFGPDTCMEGLVWREACGSGDHVCVISGRREGARDDNAAAKSRIQPGGGPYGPDTCRQGFVWREACGPGDHVCVEPRVRDDARSDNQQAGQRKKYPFCQRFSTEAVKTAVAAATFQCGFSGPLWTSTPDQYFNICLNSSGPQITGYLQELGTALTTCRQNKVSP